MAILTMIGLYNYDNSLFDGLYVPSGIDRSTLIDNILLRCGEFEIIYSSFDFTKQMISVLSNKWKLSFDKWASLTTVEYNPIHNFDRNEEWEDDSTSASNANGKSDSFVTSYDSDQLHQNGQNTNDDSATGEGHAKHKGHLFGNIGVTRTQEMMMDEIQLRKDFNVYELIADVFCEELCIMVY